MENTVLRLEWPNGDGIYYQADNSRSFCDYMEWDTERHPAPQQDSLLMENLCAKTGNRYDYSKYHFGFSSLEQLRSWFFEDRVLQIMHNKGVVISEYVCHWDDVVHGHTQAIFRKELAKSFVQHSIAEYFGLHGVDNA